MKKILVLLLVFSVIMSFAADISAVQFDPSYSFPSGWCLDPGHDHEHSGQKTVTFAFSDSSVKEKYEAYLLDAAFMWKGEIILQEVSSGNIGTVHETDSSQTSVFIHSSTVNQGSSPYHITQWNIYINEDLVQNYTDKDIVIKLAHELGHIYGLEHVSDPAQIMNSSPSSSKYSEVRSSDLKGIRICTDSHTSHNTSRVYLKNDNTVCYNDVCSDCGAYMSTNHDLEFQGCLIPLKCTICNNDVGSAVPHSLSEIVPLSYSSCIEHGQSGRYCLIDGCDYAILWYVPLDPDNHAAIFWSITSPATCVQTGLKEGICLGCGAFDLTEVIPVDPDNHAYSDWTVIAEPDCINEGLRSRACQNTGCGYIDSEILPALGHDDSGPDATCTVPKECAREGCSYIIEEAAGHDFDSWYTYVEPVCIYEGVLRRDCKNCSHYETEPISATGVHNYGGWNVTLAPSCTEPGEERRNCQTPNCTAYQTREFGEPTGHILDGIWYVHTPATCVSYGEKRMNCMECDYYESLPVSPTGVHTYGSWQIISYPTCTSSGTERRDCQYCSAYETRSYGSPTGHHWTLWYTDVSPTCTSSGVKRRDCIDCGDYETYSLPALGHSYGSWYTTVSPTCTNTGIERRNCSRCSSYETRAISSLGHDYSGAAATCTTAKTCARSFCSYVITPALGHDSSGAAATCTTPKICARSGCSYVITAALGHSYGPWYTVTSATCTTSGLRRRDCSRSYCSAYQTETIYALGHSWGSWYLDYYYYCAGRQAWVEVYRRNCTRSGCSSYQTYEEVV